MRLLFNPYYCYKETQPQHPPLEKKHSSESQRAMGDFMEFLKMLNRPAAQDLNKQCRFFVEKVQRSTQLNIEEQSELVQDFYAAIGERIKTHVAFKGKLARGKYQSLFVIGPYISFNLLLKKWHSSCRLRQALHPALLSLQGSYW